MKKVYKIIALLLVTVFFAGCVANADIILEAESPDNEVIQDSGIDLSESGSDELELIIPTETLKPTGKLESFATKQPAVDLEYEKVFSCGLAYLKYEGKYGYIDVNGNWIIEPKFDGAHAFHENGLAIVSLAGKHGLINTAGEYVAYPIYDDIKMIPSSEYIPISIDKKYGFININGELVIEPKFDSVEFFADNGLASVRLNEKYGYIDISGSFVIEPKFDYAESFKDVFPALVVIDTKYGLIDKFGNWVVEPTFSFIDRFNDDGYARFTRGENVGVIGANGKIVFEGDFDYDIIFVNDFTYNGLAIAKGSNGLFGYINTAGSWVIYPEFEIVSEFKPYGMAIVKLPNGMMGIIDEHGNYIMQTYAYDYIDRTKNNMFVIKKSGKFYLQNANGEILTETGFDFIGDFDCGRAPACINGKTGFIDESGKVVIDLKFDCNGGYFKADSYAYMPIKDGTGASKVGIIDINGNWVVEPVTK